MLETHLPDFQALIGAPGLKLIEHHGLLKSLIERAVVEDLLSNVEISDELKTLAKQSYCQKHQLGSDEALQRHISDKNISPEKFEDQLLRPFKMNQLARDEFSAKAESRFLVMKERLDRVVYSLLRLESRSQALEFYLRIANQEASFSDLAARYSQGKERNTNGVVGPAP